MRWTLYRAGLRHLRAVCWDARGLLLVLAVPVALLAGHAQNTPMGASTTPSVSTHNIEGEREGPMANPAMQEQMAERRNSERQRQLVADTDKLFHLAEQLRDEVSKSNKDQLSIPVMKKSEEIEKLAKRVKEKMRGY